jgi:uncharacterized delta-60 repeat protein
MPRPLARHAFALPVVLLAFLVLGRAAFAAALDATWGDAGVLPLAQGRTVTALLPQAGGNLIAVTENSIYLPAESPTAFVTRVTPAGEVDRAFAPYAFPCAAQGNCAARVGIDPQGRIWVAGNVPGTDPAFELHRLLPDGTPDGSFGSNGALTLRASTFCTAASCPFALSAVDSLTVLADGRALVVFDCGIAPPNVAYGTCFVIVDATGVVQTVRTVADFFQGLPWPGGVALPDGSALVSGYVFDDALLGSVAAVAKVRPDGSYDPAFGHGGIARPPISGLPSVRRIIATPQGGAMLLLNVDNAALLARLLPDGQLDAAWGNGGFVAPPSFFGQDLALLPDGSVIAVGGVLGQPGLLRLRPDGSLETRFGGAGMTTFGLESPAVVDAIAVQPGGRLILGGGEVVGYQTVYGGRAGNIPISLAVLAPRLYAVQASLGTLEHLWLEVEAVEYFNSAYGHYFLTSNDYEKQALDRGLIAGWMRTGKVFKVWAAGDPALAPVCRFWSDQTFAPKSSHFYTPYADECDRVKAGSAWQYEGIAFYLLLPTGAPGAQACGPLSQPLYRLYNNGVGGAPNHRYTVDPATVDAMVAQGWTVEGDGITRVFACVPLQGDAMTAAVAGSR